MRPIDETTIFLIVNILLALFLFVLEFRRWWKYRLERWSWIYLLASLVGACWMIAQGIRMYDSLFGDNSLERYVYLGKTVNRPIITVTLGTLLAMAILKRKC